MNIELKFDGNPHLHFEIIKRVIKRTLVCVACCSGNVPNVQGYIQRYGVDGLINKIEGQKAFFPVVLRFSLYFRFGANERSVVTRDSQTFLQAGRRRFAGSPVRPVVVVRPSPGQKIDGWKKAKKKGQKVVSRPSNKSLFSLENHAWQRTNQRTHCYTTLRLINGHK